jgi:hemerythrin-like domain-containing protein
MLVNFTARGSTVEADVPCDPFEMALVHSGFRSKFHDAAGLVRSVLPGDRKRARIIGRHIEFMLTALHHHHLAEDKDVWPKLSAREPRLGAEINRMEHAHRLIDHSRDQVRTTAAKWARTADARLAADLVPLVRQFAGVVDEHFDDEEAAVVPLLAEYLEPQEWRKFLAHGSAFVRAHPKRGLVLGAIVLDGASAETRQRFLANVPLFARTAFNMFGDKLYAGYQSEVYGPK